MISADSVNQMIDVGQGDNHRYGLRTIDFAAPHWVKWHLEGYRMRGGAGAWPATAASWPSIPSTA